MADSVILSTKFSSLDANCAVLVDDDGRVAYAYMLDADDKMCGDVWLYNRCAAPIEPEWNDRSRAPFANPAAFVDDSVGFHFPESDDEISVEWFRQDDRWFARIYILEQVAAILCKGAKPGWAKLARIDGPLAKVLHDDIE